LAEEPKIPKIVGDPAAMKSLRLSATEGFVLSRIDGKATEAELAAQTGLSPVIVRESLEKLVSLQVLTFLSRPPPAKEPAPRNTSAPRDDTRTQSSTGQTKTNSPGSPAPSSEENSPAQSEGETKAQSSSLCGRVKSAMASILPDDQDLAEEVDLPVDLRLRILATANVLDSLDYYEILGVDRGSDKKALKRAYFELAALFHPDRYFRKRLGSFKLRMETLFGRATQALDTLSNKQLRVEYDEYLVDLDRTRAAEDLVRAAAAEARRAEEDVRQSAGRATLPEINADPVRSVPSPIPPVNLPPDGRVSGLYSIKPGTAPPPAAPRPSAAPSVSDQARRDALAARLLGARALSSRPAGLTHPPSPAARISTSPSDGSRSSESDPLKRRYEERIRLARQSQATKYLALAREAETRKDVMGAANAYRVVLSFLEEGDPTVAEAKIGISKAEEALSETYLRQATYEDRSEHWADAARSWQRVIRGRPKDARAHERAAHALAKSHGDLHQAAQYAQRAVALEPGNAEYKTTLGFVFIEAGLMLNARRELEAALQLSPRNANIQALLKRVNKAG
jgi:curved DNA-binding protein CbpA